MLLTLKKGVKLPLGKRFTSLDFDCKCTRPECKVTIHDDRLSKALDELWEIAGEFVIDSGYRCLAHNREVGGVVDSTHTQGIAADCKSSKGYRGNLMARYAEEIHSLARGGIGIYPTFAHVDVRLGKARWGNPIIC